MGNKQYSYGPFEHTPCHSFHHVHPQYPQNVLEIHELVEQLRVSGSNVGTAENVMDSLDANISQQSELPNCLPVPTASRKHIGCDKQELIVCVQRAVTAVFFNLE